VIDEVHERDVNTDFVLTLLRALLRRNQHLRIILMSATASADLFVNYFADHHPTIVHIPGRSFPVHVKWLAECSTFCSSHIQQYKEDIDDSSSSSSRNDELGSGRPSNNNVTTTLSPRATDKIDNQFIRELIRAIVCQEQQQQQQKQHGKLLSSSTTISGGEKKKDGAILVFLPGRAEIEKLARVLLEDPTLGNQEFCKILKLHSAIPRTAQQLVFQPAQEGTVKIVLATNIAETSITIPGTCVRTNEKKRKEKNVVLERGRSFIVVSDVPFVCVFGIKTSLMSLTRVG
jgi:HrpA-like RNA helicase